jgi:hypothetical protein
MENPTCQAFGDQGCKTACQKCADETTWNCDTCCPGCEKQISQKGNISYCADPAISV